MPIKPSSQRIELNKTNDSLRPSTCMQSKTIRIMMQIPQIPMWLHSDHNLHSNSNSANNRATTMEIDQGDKDPTEATITTTDHRRTKASMLPEMVNSVSTAISLITPKKNVAKELMTKSLVLTAKDNFIGQKSITSTQCSIC